MNHPLLIFPKATLFLNDEVYISSLLNNCELNLPTGSFPLRHQVLIYVNTLPPLTALFFLGAKEAAIGLLGCLQILMQLGVAILSSLDFHLPTTVF